MKQKLLSLALALALAAWLSMPAQTAELASPEGIVQKMRDTYGALAAYADKGVVLHEYGTTSKDTHTFTTNFQRAPRYFRLDFRKLGSEPFVIWGDPDSFHTWNRASDQYDYPNPNNTPAIALSGYQTYSVALKVPTLLYSKAALGSDFTNLADVVLEGSEQLNGHATHRIAGRLSDTYAATGREVNLRKAILWIDAKSFLLRKVREEWRAAGGGVNRRTTSFEPQANPTLGREAFAFAPPADEP